MITPETTAVLLSATPASAGHNIYLSCIPLMESAREHNIRLHWLSLREGYSGRLYERYQRFLDNYKALKEQGYTHAFLIDAPLITFRQGLPFMCEMVQGYEPGTLYVEAVRKVYSPYENPAFLKTLEEEGVPHDSRIVFGDLETVKAVSETVLDLSREFLSNAPAMGVAADCMRDKDFAASVSRYAEDAHFLMLLASIYQPDRFRPLSMFFGDGPCADPAVIQG